MADKWINHKGEEVPAAYVRSLDKKKDKVSKRYLKRAEELNKALISFKKEVLENCDGIYSEMLAEADIELTERKGNYTITSFDKSIKIEVNKHNRVEFNDNITLAQSKINEFLTEKTEGADQDLSILVNNAFQTTKGQLDNKRILGLFQLEIKHPLWIEAIELIRKSMFTNSSKRYLTIWVKSEEGEYKQIQLNFSSI